ncbi:AvrD family protein [Microbacterium aurum]
MTSLVGRRSRSFVSALGDPATRYFGHGFKHVRHDVRLAGVHPDVTGKIHIRGTGVVSYPTAWSLDARGQPRETHLSSIDAIILTTRLLETASETGMLDLVRNATIRSITLRAGTSPHTRLDDVDIDITVITYAEFDAHVDVQAAIGGIRIAATLIPARIERPGQFAPYRDGVGVIDLDSVLLEVSGESIVTRHRVDIPEAQAIGLDSSIWPGLTHVHNVVLFGQIAQVLASVTKGIERGSIDNLWMREMFLQRTGKASGDSFSVSSTLQEHRVIERGGRRLHSLTMSSASDHGVDAIAKFGFVEPQG